MVASRRSGLMRTSGTVTMWPSSTGSCTSPCASTSASAWRTASPTRNWRCEGPAADSRCCPRAIQSSRHQSSGLSASKSAALAPGSKRAPCLREKYEHNQIRASKRPLHHLDTVAFDDVALAHVLEVLERHAAFLAGADFARVVLEALELRQLAFVDHHVVADEAHLRPALDRAVGHAAARHL